MGRKSIETKWNDDVSPSSFRWIQTKPISQDFSALFCSPYLSVTFLFTLAYTYIFTDHRERPRNRKWWQATIDRRTFQTRTVQDTHVKNNLWSNCGSILIMSWFCIYPILYCALPILFAPSSWISPPFASACVTWSPPFRPEWHFQNFPSWPW